jgi:hypothetical protein
MRNRVDFLIDSGTTLIIVRLHLPESTIRLISTVYSGSTGERECVLVSNPRIADLRLFALDVPVLKPSRHLLQLR